MPRKQTRPTCPPEQILEGFSARVIALANRVRKLLLGMIDGVIEYGMPGWRLIGFRRRGYFAFIQPMPDHVRLGFEHGAALPNIGGLLEGDGKQVRFVSIRSARAAGSRALKTLLSAALFDDDTHGFRRRRAPALTPAPRRHRARR
jgi:hypothetical protein